MNNNLILTKIGFYDDSKILLSNLPVEFCAISEEYLMNGRKTLEIVSNNPTRLLYQIDFPERFIPHNGMGWFCDKVKDLMKQGVMFEIKTTCVIFVGWIPRTHVVDNMTNVGWDSISIHRFNEEPYDIGRGYYGCDINSLIMQIQF